MLLQKTPQKTPLELNLERNIILFVFVRIKNLNRLLNALTFIHLRTVFKKQNKDCELHFTLLLFDE